MQSVVNLMAADSQRVNPRILRGGTIIAVGSGPRIAEARNTVCEMFLKTQTEWLLMLDTDMVFSPDAVDKILEAADPVEKPIIGGLCFGGGRSGIMFPTMYRLKKPDHVNESPIEIMEDYPEDALQEVHATGAAFLLMHRTALEKVRDHFAGAPYPWFLEGSVYKKTKFGEDWAFCMRAIEAGLKIYVHTGVKIGHVKPQVLDEDAWFAFKAKKAEIGEAGVNQYFKRKIMGGAEAPSKAPTHVVIPQKNKHLMTVNLVNQLLQQKDVDRVWIFDNGSSDHERERTMEYGRCHDKVTVIPAEGETLHQMWNEGVERILKEVDGPVNIAILNNDLRIGPHFLLRQATALRADDELTAVSPNYDKRKGSGVTYVKGCAAMGGMAGFAFMFKGELFRDEDPFDERFGWWYGDDDFALRIMDSGKHVGLVYGATVEHLNGGSQTAKDIELGEQIAADRALFAEKHGFTENADGVLERGIREEVGI